MVDGALTYDEKLKRLVFQAWDLKQTPYMTDACQAIVDFHDQSWEERLDGRLLQQRDGEDG